MKNVVILLLIIGLGHGVAFADESKATAASKGIPQRVDKMFEKWDKTISPGCALAVMKDGKIVYKRGYGMADLDHNIPITSTTVFHVASMSKQFTAAATVMLAQDGKLLLDDPVRKFIPELPDFGVPITVRQLIHHTSGLRDQWDLLGLAVRTTVSQSVFFATIESCQSLMRPTRHRATPPASAPFSPLLPAGRAGSRSG